MPVVYTQEDDAMLKEECVPKEKDFWFPFYKKIVPKKLFNESINDKQIYKISKF